MVSQWVAVRVRDQLAARSESERKDRPRPPEEEVVPSQAVVPIFALSVIKNGDPDLSQPVNRIRLSPTSKSIILLLETLERFTAQERYVLTARYTFL